MLENTAAYKSVLTDGGYIHNTLRGLRSVRNRIGHEVSLTGYVDLEDDLVDLPGGTRFANWAWREVPPPTATGRYAKWPLADHEAYVKALQGEPVLEAFSVAGRYLKGIGNLVYPPGEPHSWPPDSGDELPESAR